MELFQLAFKRINITSLEGVGRDASPRRRMALSTAKLGRLPAPRQSFQPQPQKNQ